VVGVARNSRLKMRIIQIKNTSTIFLSRWAKRMKSRIKFLIKEFTRGTTRMNQIMDHMIGRRNLNQSILVSIPTGRDPSPHTKRNPKKLLASSRVCTTNLATQATIQIRQQWEVNLQMTKVTGMMKLIIKPQIVSSKTQTMTTAEPSSHSMRSIFKELQML